MTEIINFPNKKKPDLEKEKFNYTREENSTYVSNYALRTKIKMEDSFKTILSHMHVVIEQFTEQVTCVCTKTGDPLFDLERALEFRRTLSELFYSLLETIDEEIDEETKTETAKKGKDGKVKEKQKQEPSLVDWNVYRKNLDRLSVEDLIDSHVYEGKKRNRLELFLANNGFSFGPTGWRKEVFKKPYVIKTE